jgi:hypothetical protein
MLYNAALPQILNAMLKDVPFISIPNNPKNKKREKKPLKYLFISTRVVEHKDADGVVHMRYKGISCRRGEAKAPSKRDIHRSNQEN